MKINEHNNYDDERVDLVFDFFLKVISYLLIGFGFIGTVYLLIALINE